MGPAFPGLSPGREVQIMRFVLQQHHAAARERVKEEMLVSELIAHRTPAVAACTVQIWVNKQTAHASPAVG